MNEPGPALTRFVFMNGELRGSNLTLYPTCLVHRSDSHLETLPLSAVTAVRVSFLRGERRLGWGVVLLLVGLGLLAIASPLGNYAGSEVAKGQNLALMQFFYRMLEAVAALLPVLALLAVIGGCALIGFGWIGRTTLVVGIPGAERAYGARGRNTMLLDFAEALSERLTAVKR